MTGETVSFASTSYDPESPITALAWDLQGSAAGFDAQGAVVSTVFTTPGNHPVRLRVTAADGSSSEAVQTVAVSSPVPVEMLPFPVVRFVATSKRYGATVRLLSVEAPPGAQITIQCAGRGCPLRYRSRIATPSSIEAVTIAFPRFQRFLPAGAVLEIRVSKAGEIGKYTRIAIRRGKSPTRLDECLASTGPPAPCPGS